MKEKYRIFLFVIKCALPFTEFYRRNDENRIGGTLRCFDAFSNSLGESSKVILNKSPIYIFAPIFFYRAENGKDVSTSKSHHKSEKPVDVEVLSLT
jgi:hypothetical protein